MVQVTRWRLPRGPPDGKYIYVKEPGPPGDQCREAEKQVLPGSIGLAS